MNKPTESRKASGNNFSSPITGERMRGRVLDSRTSLSDKGRRYKTVNNLEGTEGKGKKFLS